MKTLIAIGLLITLPALAQAPLISPNRISPEQQAALDNLANLEKRKPADAKECEAIKLKTPLRHPGNAVAEQQAVFAKCMTDRGHYVPE